MSDERHNGVSSNGTLAQLPPETEVVVRRKPRKFTPAFKVSFLKAAEACKKPGEIGVLLRREGLYYEKGCIIRRLPNGNASEPTESGMGRPQNLARKKPLTFAR